MIKELDAIATVRIKAPIADVWDVLVSPEIIKKYMYGAEVDSDWKVGSLITWKGEWKGKTYEDLGVILKIEKEKTLQYSHYSPLSGLPDIPENYHTVTYNLLEEGDQVLVALTQDNNSSIKMMEESQKMWDQMLSDLKKTVENKSQES